MQQIMYIVYSFGLAASAACLTAIMTQKASEEQKLMSGLTFFTCIAWLGYWISSQSETIQDFINSSKIIYTGSCYLYLFLFLFICRFCHLKIPAGITVMLALTSFIINTAALTMDYHHYFFKSVDLMINGEEKTFIIRSGIGHWLFINLGLIYCIVITIITIWSMFRGHQRPVSVMGLASTVLVPNALNTLNALSIVHIDLTPIGYIYSELIIFILIYGSKLYDVKDTAREFIIDSLDDAIVVLDSGHHFKGCNEMAKKLFPELASAQMDSRIDTVSNQINVILHCEDAREMDFGGRIYSSSIKQIGGQHIDAAVDIPAEEGAVQVPENGDKVRKEKKKKKNDAGEIRGYVIWLTDVTEQVRNRVLLNNYNDRLKSDVDAKTKQIETMQEHIIYSFASLIESRDTDTGEHVRRTSEYVYILARELRDEGCFPEILDKNYVDNLRLAAPLHDIGKMVVPDSVLKKPGRLSDEEFAIMKQHTVEGGKILDNTLKGIEGETYFDIAKEMAVYHHEKWNGMGYPYGISGEKIPVSARIMAVADLFDALTSSRPYKRAYSVDKAYSILEEESGRQLDPRMVDCFIRVRPEVEAVITALGGELPTDDAPLSERDAYDLIHGNAVR